MACDRQVAIEDFSQTKSAVIFNPSCQEGELILGGLISDRLQVVSLLASFNSKAVNGVQLCLYSSVHVRVCCQSELQTLGTTRNISAYCFPGLSMTPWSDSWPTCFQSFFCEHSYHFYIDIFLFLFHIYTYICVYVCICIYVYTYTHINSLSSCTTLCQNPASDPTIEGCELPCRC